MPAYGKNLSPAEVSALVAFMETLRPSYQPPARDSTESVRLPTNESVHSPSKDLRADRVEEADMDTVAAAALSSWSFSAPLMCALLALALIYFRGWRLLSAERPHKYTTRRLVSFASGLTTIFVALASPIDALAGLLLEAHMIQHLLLIMVAPPLLWLGQPVLPLLRGLTSLCI